MVTGNQSEQQIADELTIRGVAPDHRRAVRHEMSRPLVDAFFDWLPAQAARVSRKSELGKALAYMLKRQAGFRLFLEDGHVDMDSNLVENAIRSPAMNRRNALFAGHDEGGRSWARMASLIGSAKMNGVDPYAYLVHLFTRLAQGHLNKGNPPKIKRGLEVEFSRYFQTRRFE